MELLDGKWLEKFFIPLCLASLLGTGSLYVRLRSAAWEYPGA